jgi:hypothetical protein
MSLGQEAAPVAAAAEYMSWGVGFGHPWRCRYCGEPFKPTARGVCLACAGPPLGWDVRRAVA